jgi:hypothetical protein
MTREAAQIRSAMRPNLPDADAQDLHRRARAIPSTLMSAVKEFYPNRARRPMQQLNYDLDLDIVDRFLRETVAPLRADLGRSFYDELDSRLKALVEIVNTDSRLQLSFANVTRESIESWSEAASAVLNQIQRILDSVQNASSAQLNSAEQKAFLSQLQSLAGSVTEGLGPRRPRPLPRATGPETPPPTKGISKGH